MTEQSPKNAESSNQKQAPNPDDQAIDPRDLVTKPGLGPDQDPREIVNNPAVTPEMLNEPGDIRGDLIERE